LDKRIRESYNSHLFWQNRIAIQRKTREFKGFVARFTHGEPASDANTAAAQSLI
jgi:hypothetical protein